MFSFLYFMGDIGNKKTPYSVSAVYGNDHNQSNSCLPSSHMFYDDIKM